MSAYYNEFDPYAAQWLRNLIKAGHIAPGDVDERSIVDVRADDLRGYRQCHFFAGIGVWSYALRKAGWSDEEEVWTGSCPCQPFSAAGKGEAFDDERDLWPAFFALIRERRPVVVAGEQVASRLGLAWLDAVHADLEGETYTVGAVDTCSAGVGSPNIRQRLYWLGHASDKGSQGYGRPFDQHDSQGREKQTGHRSAPSLPSRMALTDGRNEGNGLVQRSGEHGQQPEDGGACGMANPQGADREVSIREWGPHEGFSELGGRSRSCGLAYAERWPTERHGHALAGEARGVQGEAHKRERLRPDVRNGCEPSNRPGPLNGFWRAADWLCCTDGKWRAVESGAFPLVTGTPARLGRLRAYGNAINAQVATEFMRAVKGELA